MLWLDIGAFCGYRRKMEIAEGYLQPLVTVSTHSNRNDEAEVLIVERPCAVQGSSIK